MFQWGAAHNTVPVSCMPLRASDSVRFESMRGKVFSESQRNRLLCAEGRSGINPRRLSAVAAVANHQKTTQNRTYIGSVANACHSACNFDPLSRGIGVQN